MEFQPGRQSQSTPSFEHRRVKKRVVHAVGSVFRENSLNSTPVEEKYTQLSQAYNAAMEEASRHECEDIGFCLLSAGVFRGSVPLEKMIRLGVDGVEMFYRDNGGSSLPKFVSFVAYTQEEQIALAKVFAEKRVEGFSLT